MHLLNRMLLPNSIKWILNKSKLKTDDFWGVIFTKNAHRGIQVWPSVEQTYNIRTECLERLLISMFVLLFSSESDGKVWLQPQWIQAVCGNHGNSDKIPPAGHRGPLCSINIKYDIIIHSVMEHTHKVSEKTVSHFHSLSLKERLNEEGVVTRTWRGHVKMQPAQTLGLSSPQILKLETSQLTSFCGLVMSHTNYEGSLMWWGYNRQVVTV